MTGSKVKKYKEEGLNIHHAETIDEAIDDTEEFLQCDVWHNIEDRIWKKEEDMLRYFDTHFKILREEIRLIRNKELKR